MAIIYEWNASERRLEVDFGLLAIGIATGIISGVIASILYDKYVKKSIRVCRISDVKKK